MIEPDRRPTAQDIEELIDLVRRDPASPAFLDLCEAYLALGRPKDAISVGNVGLKAAPDRLEGRLLLARAYTQLHQWKEAQGELLALVKADRSHQQGFAMLGEILLRREDFQRAVPVLQHAQHLDPTSPHVLALLKRARSGYALDPPPPIPQPVPPRGETNSEAEFDSMRETVPGGGQRDPSGIGRGFSMGQGGLDPSRGLGVRGTPSMGEPRGSKPANPPQISIEGVRPRVVSAAKPTNPAASALRQSAAVGENYLNALLTAGLLDVAGVRVPDSDFDLRPDRRWGRSTRRAFAFLFIVLTLGIGGGAGAYWWDKKARAEKVAKLQVESKAAIGSADFSGLETAIAKLDEAFKKDPNNLLSFAYVAEAAGLEALLYGTDRDRVDRAIKAVVRDIKDGAPGARELVIGRAAVELSRLDSQAAPATTLGEVRKLLDGYLAAHSDDKWAGWLKARATLAAGERTAGRAMLKSLGEGSDGLAIAMIEFADMLVDDGNLDEAFALYDKALAKAKDHPLALLGRALARAESSVQTTDAIEDLNVKLEKNFGPRVTAYRSLALAVAQAGIEEYGRSLEALKKAALVQGTLEPRLLARVAWVYYTRGALADAATARKPIAWYGKAKAEDDPVVKLVDAGFLLASGLPSRALDESSKLAGVRAGLLRAYAQIDLGKAKDAAAELDLILKKAPDNLEAQILREQVRMLVAGSDGKARAAAADALERLARKAKSKLGRHALGMAYHLLGDPKAARPQLEQAIANITDESPNPLSYRTRTALADIFASGGDIPGAGKFLDDALQANSGYFPALAMQAKVVLRNGDPDRALSLLAPLMKENGAMTPQSELTLAEALCTHSTPPVTAKDREDAAGLLANNKDAALGAEVVRIAAVCGSKGAPAPPAGGPGAGPTKNRRPRRR
jgi:tetratricopeptide (TPR) repeat protein